MSIPPGEECGRRDSGQERTDILRTTRGRGARPGACRGKRVWGTESGARRTTVGYVGTRDAASRGAPRGGSGSSYPRALPWRAVRSGEGGFNANPGGSRDTTTAPSSQKNTHRDLLSSNRVTAQAVVHPPCRVPGPDHGLLRAESGVGGSGADAAGPRDLTQGRAGAPHAAPRGRHAP